MCCVFSVYRGATAGCDARTRSPGEAPARRGVGAGETQWAGRRLAETRPASQTGKEVLARRAARLNKNATTPTSLAGRGAGCAHERLPRMLRFQLLPCDHAHHRHSRENFRSDPSTRPACRTDVTDPGSRLCLLTHAIVCDAMLSDFPIDESQCSTSNAKETDAQRRSLFLVTGSEGLSTTVPCTRKRHAPCISRTLATSETTALCPGFILSYIVLVQVAVTVYLQLPLTSRSCRWLRECPSPEPANCLAARRSLVMPAA